LRPLTGGIRPIALANLGIGNCRQTPLSTFRTLRLPDGDLNVGGASVGSPIQLQFAMRYLF